MNLTGFELMIRKSDKEMMMKQYEKYKNSTATKLSDVYGRYGYEKERVMNEWEQFLGDEASELRILSHNQNFFTLGFEVVLHGQKYFCYITKDHNRMVKL